MPVLLRSLHNLQGFPINIANHNNNHVNIMTNRLQSALRRRDAKLRRKLRKQEEVFDKKKELKNIEFLINLPFSDNTTTAVGDT